MNKNNYDVIVIGGGPAGSTAAFYLRCAGIRVALFEKEEFPRPHVGEALLPFCYHLFAEMGVLSVMEKSFIRKPGIRFTDIDEKEYSNLCFSHIIDDPSYLSFNVRRDEFDQILLENAQKKGTYVFQNSLVKDVAFSDIGNPVSVLVRHNDSGMEQTYYAKYLVDASGQGTFLANKMNSKRKFPNLDRVAFNRHWQNAEYINGLQEGIQQIIYIGEEEKQGWVWLIPVDKDLLSVGVALNNQFISKYKNKIYKKYNEKWKNSIYESELFKSAYVESVLKNAKPVNPLLTHGDYSYFVTNKYDMQYAIVGDASTFIDPIFATGIFLSMKSAQLVSEGLAQFINSGDFAKITHAYEKIDGAYKLVEKLIHIFYNPRMMNFHQLDSSHPIEYKEHHSAIQVIHRVLAGDFFDKFNEYSSFMDLLKYPEQYNRYRNLVYNDLSGINRLSCNTN